MTKSKRRKPHEERTRAAARPPRPWRNLLLAAILVVAAGLVLRTWRRDPAPAGAALPSGGAAGAPTAADSPAQAITASDTPAHYRSLVGEWLRSDGGYVLTVTGVAADGRAAAAYFNPRPIRVAQAQARREGDLVGLFVKLDDVGYPGSTYTLGYDAASRELRGIYYQAAQGQQYEVVFVRQR